MPPTATWRRRRGRRRCPVMPRGVASDCHGGLHDRSRECCAHEGKPCDEGDDVLLVHITPYLSALLALTQC